ncbi:MAG TPA: HAD family phosphatase [Bacteroidales bacterium]|nr:HAD family phosphatase [Bacteroidales bacterium]
MQDAAAKISKAAFFDLDRTVIRAVSGRELVRGAYRKGLMRTSDVIHGIVLSASFSIGLKSEANVIDNLVRWVKGMPESALHEICADVTMNILIPAVYGDAAAKIAFHHSRGDRVIILSSALRCVCEQMTAYLGADDFICSDLEVSDKILTGNPKGRICFGEEKLSRFLEYCWKNGTSVANTWYYADSVSDIPVLSVTGNPVCVNPDKKLEKEAGKKGWKILRFQ